jgi:hypothetical protein
MCIAVGTGPHGAGPPIERWNGRRWALQQAPAVESATTLSSVACTSFRACTAVGYVERLVGKRPVIARWNGRTWSTQRPDPRSRIVPSDVSCASATMCVTVGALNQCASEVCISSAEIQRWNGRRWSLQRIPLPRSAVDVSLSDVSCSSATACAAVGSWDSGQSCRGRCPNGPLIERWNGAKWLSLPPPQHTPEIGDIGAVSCPSATACTALGSREAVRWNGTSWTIERMPNPRNGGFFQSLSVDCPTSRVCTAIRLPSTRNGHTQSLAYRWTRGRWSVAQLPGPKPATGFLLSDVACPSAATCVAVGSTFLNDSGAAVPLTERWRDSRWSIQPTPSPRAVPDAGLVSVSCAAIDDCTAVGNSAPLPGAASTPPLVERWDGSSWTIVSAPIPPLTYGGGADGGAVSCIANSACTLVGPGSVSPNPPFAEFSSGSTWSIEQMPSPGASSTGLSGVSCAAANDCVAVGQIEVSAAGVLTTEVLIERMDGSGWRIDQVGNPSGATTSALNAVSCVTSTWCLAVGDSGAAQTQAPLAEVWDGSNWSAESPPTPPGATAPVLNGVSCMSVSECTVVGSYAVGNNRDTLAERWDGSSWTIQSTANVSGAMSTTLNSVSCQTAISCTAVGAADASTVTEAWDGSTWTIEQTPTPPGARTSSLAAVSCTSPVTCMAVGTYAPSVTPDVTHPLAERSS